MLQNGEMPRPYFADLQPSNRCNQNCKGCSYRNIHDGVMLSEENLIKIVNDLMDFGVKGFDFCGGGEPMTLSCLPKVWDLIKSRKGYYALITNGTIMSDSVIEQLVNQATYVRFSFEASSVSKYCQYKNVDISHWHLLGQHAYELVKKKRETRSDCEVGIKFAVGKSLRGEKHYQNALDIYKRILTDNIQFKALRHKPEELSQEEKEEEQKLFQSIFQGVSQARAWIVPEKEIPQCWLNPLHTVVDEKGNVYICCYFYYRGEEHLLGNMLEQPIKNIWYDPQHMEKIKGISKIKCMEVDCKFFRHHKLVEKELTNGKSCFL